MDRAAGVNETIDRALHGFSGVSRLTECAVLRPAAPPRPQKQKGTVNDVQKGRRVIVNIGNGEDPLIAREIQLGVTKNAEP